MPDIDSWADEVKKRAEEREIRRRLTAARLKSLELDKAELEAERVAASAQARMGQMHGPPEPEPPGLVERMGGSVAAGALGTVGHAVRGAEEGMASALGGDPAGHGQAMIDKAAEMPMVDGFGGEVLQGLGSAGAFIGAGVAGAAAGGAGAVAGTTAMGYALYRSQMLERKARQQMRERILEASPTMSDQEVEARINTVLADPEVARQMRDMAQSIGTEAAALGGGALEAAPWLRFLGKVMGPAAAVFARNPPKIPKAKLDALLESTRKVAERKWTSSAARGTIEQGVEEALQEGVGEAIVQMAAGEDFDAGKALAQMPVGAVVGGALGGPGGAIAPAMARKNLAKWEKLAEQDQQNTPPPTEENSATAEQVFEAAVETETQEAVAAAQEEIDRVLPSAEHSPVEPEPTEAEVEESNLPQGQLRVVVAAAVEEESKPDDDAPPLPDPPKPLEPDDEGPEGGVIEKPEAAELAPPLPGGTPQQPATPEIGPTDVVMTDPIDDPEMKWERRKGEAAWEATDAEGRLFEIRQSGRPARFTVSIDEGEGLTEVGSYPKLKDAKAAIEEGIDGEPQNGKESKIIEGEDGKPVRLYHSGDIEVSDTVEISGLGMHMGTREAARERVHGRALELAVESVEAEFETNEDGIEGWFWNSSVAEMDTDSAPFDTEEEALDSGREESLLAAQEALDLNDDPTEGQEGTSGFVAMANPLRLPDLQNWEIDDVINAVRKKGIEVADDADHDAVREAIEKAGFDGIVYKNRFEGNNDDSYVIFRPEQLVAQGDSKPDLNAPEGEVEIPEPAEGRIVDMFTLDPVEGLELPLAQMDWTPEGIEDVKRMAQDAFSEAYGAIRVLMSVHDPVTGNTEVVPVPDEWLDDIKFSAGRADGYKSSFQANRGLRVEAEEIVRRIFPHVKSVTFVNALFGKGTELAESQRAAGMTVTESAEVGGSVDRGRMLVKLSLGEQFDVRETAYHEAYHLARQNLTEEEVSALEDEYLDEEHEARSFAKWALAKDEQRAAELAPKGGWAKRAFGKIKTLFAEVGSALRRNGYSKTEDIFDAIYSGEVGRRFDLSAKRAKAVKAKAKGKPVKQPKRDVKVSYPQRVRRPEDYVAGVMSKALNPPVTPETEDAIRAERESAGYPSPGTGKTMEDVRKRGEAYAARARSLAQASSVPTGELDAMIQGMRMIVRDALKILGEVALKVKKNPDDASLLLELDEAFKVYTDAYAKASMKASDIGMALRALGEPIGAVPRDRVKSYDALLGMLERGEDPPPMELPVLYSAGKRKNWMERAKENKEKYTKPQPLPKASKPPITTKTVVGKDGKKRRVAEISIADAVDMRNAWRLKDGLHKADPKKTYKLGDGFRALFWRKQQKQQRESERYERMRRGKASVSHKALVELVTEFRAGQVKGLYELRKSDRKAFHKWVDAIIHLSKLGEDKDAAKAIENINKGGLREWVLWAAYNAWLSNPVSFLWRNSFGGAAMLYLWRPTQLIGSATVDTVGRRFFGWAEPADPFTQAPKFNELGMNVLFGSKKDYGAAFKAFMAMWAHGKDSDPAGQFEQGYSAFDIATLAPPDGKSGFLSRPFNQYGVGMLWPVRFMAAGDVFFRTLATRMELRLTGARLLEQKDIREAAEVETAEDARDWTDMFVDDPPLIFSSMAQVESRQVTHTQTLDGLPAAFEKWRNKYAAGYALFPFIKIIINQMTLGLRLLPGATLISHKARRDIRTPGKARANEVMKIGFGIGLTLWVMNMVRSGMMTGGGEEDPNRRNTWRMIRQPYSLLANGRWHDISEWTEHLSYPMAVMATMFEAMGMGTTTERVPLNEEEKSALEIGMRKIGRVLLAIPDSLFQKSFAANPARLYRYARDPERFPGAVTDYMANLLRPAIFGAAIRLREKHLYDVRTPEDALNRALGNPEGNVPPILDPFGDPLNRHPVGEKTYLHRRTYGPQPNSEPFQGPSGGPKLYGDPVDPEQYEERKREIATELNRIGYGFQSLPTQLGGIPLDPWERYRLGQVRGWLRFNAIHALMSTPAYWRQESDQMRAKLVNSVVSKASISVKQFLSMELAAGNDRLLRLYVKLNGPVLLGRPPLKPGAALLE